MLAWKILVIGAALVAMSIITMGAGSVAPHGSAVVAQTNPEPDLEPVPSRYGVSAAERAYGSDPIRIEDW
jgi:hypothetical protein